VEICGEKGILMQLGKLDIKNYDLSSFDVITSFEVIEHINDPSVEVEKFYKLLRKNGLTYITTPNFNSLLRYHLKAAYNVIGYPEHLSYYTRKTLKILFNNHSFKPVKIETTGISLSRFKSSKNSTENRSIAPDSADEKLRLSLENTGWKKLLKNVINSLLTLFGVGDNLKGMFVKK
jgi:SAM-dependent methyltransferase